MDTCSQCVVRESAICSSLSPGKLDELTRAGRRQRLRAGQTLMWEGDDSQLVGNVIGGILKLSVTSADGREQSLGIAYPSDFVGRAFGTRRNHSITAITDAEVCTFERPVFDAFARGNAGLEHDLLERTLSELDRVRQWMFMLGRMIASARLAAFLIEMAERLCPAGADEEGASVEFELPFGRQEIADLLGLTIETVSRQITKLKEARVIGTPNRRSIVILDPEALEVCAAA